MSSVSQFEVQIPSDTGEGLAVQERIISLMEQKKYSVRDIFAMRLSLEEAITNAIRHGNKLDPNKLVTVVCEVSDKRLKVIVRDEGDGFTPDEVPDPTADEFIERPCGRGLMLMRAYLDVCEYNRNGTEIRLERDRNSPLPIMDEDD